MSSTIEIVRPAESLDLTTLETVKQEFAISEEDTKEDARLSRWISECSEQINSYVGRVLAMEWVKETFQLTGSNIGAIRLRRWPVVTIVSIAVDGRTIDGGYRLDAGKGILTAAIGGNRGPWPGREIVVEHQSGYSLIDGLPRAIETAAIKLVQIRRWSADRDPTLRSENLPGVLDVSYVITRDGALPGDVRGLLAPFRDFAVA